MAAPLSCSHNLFFPEKICLSIESKQFGFDLNDSKLGRGKNWLWDRDMEFIRRQKIVMEMS